LYPPAQLAFVALRIAAKQKKLDNQFGQYTGLKMKIRPDWKQLEENFKSMFHFFKPSQNASAKSIYTKWEELRKYIRTVMEARSHHKQQEYQKLHNVQSQMIIEQDLHEQPQYQLPPLAQPLLNDSNRNNNNYDNKSQEQYLVFDSLPKENNFGPMQESSLAQKPSRQTKLIHVEKPPVNQ